MVNIAKNVEIGTSLIRNKRYANLLVLFVNSGMKKGSAPCVMKITTLKMENALWAEMILCYFIFNCYGSL